MIEQKVAGKEVTFEEEAPKAQIIDLMEALKASLGEDEESGEASDSGDSEAKASA